MKIVDRPGYFGSKRPEKEAHYDSLYGKGNWSEMWEIDGRYHPFIEAVQLYDFAYLEFLTDYPAIADFVALFDECYDNDISNIDTGLQHDPASSPRHIQDVSVRRAMFNLGRPFAKMGVPSNQQEPSRLLRIRSTDSNGYILSPMNVPFHRPELILPDGVGGPLPKWCPKADSVEAFWQRNKVIIVD